MRGINRKVLVSRARGCLRRQRRRRRSPAALRRPPPAQTPPIWCSHPRATRPPRPRPGSPRPAAQSPRRTHRSASSSPARANPDFATAASGAGVEAVASTTGLGTPLEEDEVARDGRLHHSGGHGQPDGRAALGPAVGHDADRRRRGSRGDDRRARTSSSACSTAASPARTPTWRRRSPRTRARPASAASSTRPRPRGTRRRRATARTSPGTIAAAINGVGIAGVAPGVKVAAVKVVTDAGFIYPEAAVCGFVWAADHGMQITNNSYFIDPWEFNCRNDARQRPVWQAVQRAIRYSQIEGRAQRRLGRELERRPAAQVRRRRQPERRQLPGRDPRDQRRLPRPARRGAGRRHRLRGRHASG